MAGAGERGMATDYTHAVVGLGLARLYAAEPMRWPYWCLAALLPASLAGLFGSAGDDGEVHWTSPSGQFDLRVCRPEPVAVVHGQMEAIVLAAAGDQVPPGTPEYRIEMMRELVEEHGKF